MSRDNRAYIEYYDTHRDEFRDEPNRAVCGTMMLRMLNDGRLTPEENKRRAAKRRKRWEDFHLAKAHTLGYQFDLKRLDWDLSGLARELRARDYEPT